MVRPPVLTIAIPTYNMKDYLPQNLNSLPVTGDGRIEILVLDNSSTDGSGQIADEFAALYPRSFTVIHKENHGYGSSVNLAIAKARGQFLRIVDADDWVDTEELICLLQDLENCTADLVICDYTTVNTDTGMETRINTCPKAISEGDYFSPWENLESIPQMHSVIFRVEFLQKNGISLLEDTFYVDEQLMILTYMHARSLVYYKYNVYYYRVGNVAQSISSVNMGIRYMDRERELRSSLAAYQKWAAINGYMPSCTRQLAKHAGNHFTTLYMYVEPAAAGRVLAEDWRSFLRTEWPEIYHSIAGKQRILALLNRMHLRKEKYQFLHEKLIKQMRN